MGLSVDQIKELVSGKEVSLEGKGTIKPETMFNAPIQPASALVFFVPSANYLPSLFSNKQLSAYCSKGPEIGMIYHSAPYDVLSNPAYLDFVAKIGPKASHIVDCKELNDDTSPRYYSQSFVQLLNKCNSRLFPEPSLKPIHTKSLDKRAELTKECNKRGLKLNFALAGHDYGIWPGTEVSKQSLLQGLHQPATLSADAKIAAELQSKIAASPELSSIHKACSTVLPERKFANEPMFVILGTASQKPLKYRCVSSIYVNLPGCLDGKVPRGNTKEYYESSFGMLLDCGEGTYGQLMDHFWQPGVLDSVVENVKCIFISHYHGDHTFGLAKMLKECDKALVKRYGKDLAAKTAVAKERTLYLLLPSNVKKTAELMMQANSLVFPERVRVLETELLNPDPEMHYSEDPNDHPTPAVVLAPEQTAKLIENLCKNAGGNVKEVWSFFAKLAGVKLLHVFSTNHARGSHGLVLVGDGWKVTYGGDTSPCPTLESFARGSDLLIHECTFSDNLPRKEEDIRHTTLAQCVGIFDATKPWRMLLTHFSNKSNKIVNVAEEHSKRKICTAFDQMQFMLSDTEWISQLQPLLEALITNDQLL